LKEWIEIGRNEKDNTCIIILPTTNKQKEYLEKAFPKEDGWRRFKEA